MNSQNDKAAPPASPATDHPPAGTGGDAPGPTASGPTASGPHRKSGEIGGPPGPEPTRYGDWESKGRCTDF